MIMKGFHHLYSGTGRAIKISYIILILILLGIGFYFVSMPKLQNEPATETTIQTTRTTVVTTIPENTFVPSNSNYKPAYFAENVPVWEYSLPENYWIASPEDGEVYTLSKNKFLITSDEWNLLYLLDISEDIGNIDGSVKAGQPITQLKSNVVFFGAAKNCEQYSDIFSDCKFVDPAEYFEGRR